MLPTPLLLYFLVDLVIVHSKDAIVTDQEKHNRGDWGLMSAVENPIKRRELELKKS